VTETKVYWNLLVTATQITVMIRNSEKIVLITVTRRFASLLIHQWRRYERREIESCERVVDLSFDLNGI